MDASARRAALTAKHAKLEQAIEEEMRRPLPDTLHLSTLKREKLRIKDEIAKLSDE
ncbi:MAG: YdcH family protein [Alphaproteobacteria bacterium]